MPTPVVLNPDEINLGSQVAPVFTREQDLGDPNVAPAIREVNITSISGGGGGSVRPTSGMIYPRGIC